MRADLLSGMSCSQSSVAAVCFTWGGADSGNDKMSIFIANGSDELWQCFCGDGLANLPQKIGARWSPGQTDRRSM